MRLQDAFDHVSAVNATISLRCAMAAAVLSSSKSVVISHLAFASNLVLGCT